MKTIPGIGFDGCGAAEQTGTFTANLKIKNRTIAAGFANADALGSLLRRVA